MKISLRRIVFFTTLVFSSLFLVSGQDLDDVTISGQVFDSNQLPIPGASITAEHVESKVLRTLTSDGEGRYRFVELRPGNYRLAVTAAGFGMHKSRELHTISAQNLRFNFTLLPADVQASATVTADADVPLIDTTRTIVGGTVS